MSSSLVYSANTNVQPFVATGTTINFGSVVRRYGCNTNVIGGDGVINGSGYYTIYPFINISGTAGGTATIQFYKDGAPIPGSMIRFTTADGVLSAITPPPMAVRQKCCCEANITATITGVAGNIIDATILITKE